MMYTPKRRKEKHINVETHPCPYHSRSKNSSNSNTISDKHEQSPIPLSHKALPHPKFNKKMNKLSLPSIKEKKKVKKEQKGQKRVRMKSLENERVFEGKNDELLFEKRYKQFGNRIYKDFNYYEDMYEDRNDKDCQDNHLNAQPKSNRRIICDAHRKVQQIYMDEYYNVREELEIIKRVQARHKVLLNIKRDKRRLLDYINKSSQQQCGEKISNFDKQPFDSDQEVTTFL